MRLTLFIVSLLIILGGIPAAILFNPLAGNVQGGGWNVPFWPFVLIIGVVLNPLAFDLASLYLKTRVEIAQAEHPAQPVQTPAPPADVTKISKPPVPPSPPNPPPTDTAGGVRQ